MPGLVYLVGAGPWSPDLLTARGQGLLAMADAVLHDPDCNPDLLALASPGAERLPVADAAQAVATMVRRAAAGDVVVRLTPGDPAVFGPHLEIEGLVAAGVPHEVVPGVLQVAAGASQAGLALTGASGGRTVAFGTDDLATESGWADLAQADTVAVSLTAQPPGGIAQALLAAGRDPQTPAALIRRPSRPDQHLVWTTLGQVQAAWRHQRLTPPAVLLVGPAAAAHAARSAPRHKPLHGRRIGVTRSAAQQGPLVGRLAELGAEVVAMPTIHVTAPDDPARVAEAVAALGTYHWVLFTSANGVDRFLDAVYAQGRDPRAFGSARLACIGPATARRLRQRGLVPDLIPERYVAEAFLEALPEDLEGVRVLLPRAEVAREVLPDTLRQRGATVDVVPVYRTVPAAVAPEARLRVVRGEVDLLTFTASSTVSQFVEALSSDELAEVVARVPAACIGPITAQTARAAGFHVAIEAARFTVPGLVDAVVAWAAPEP
ncbi:MAG: uroporphyrinogen-III synthase [Myxococcales bacterium]|nr:uroporphyrinogen-III synthase [Myxococcales bacterium]MCB9524881.1 uroporphyrinogen-III synthase [Myxococcales bacterium]